MKNIICVITVVAMYLQSGILLAQKVSNKSSYSFERLEEKTPWIVSDNGAGLVYNDALNFSAIEAYYGHQEGQFRNYNDPEKYQTFGIQTRSYMRIKKVYFYGSFNYDYGIKNNQSWLGTIYPDATLNPILDSIPGKALREDYILCAKVGYPLNDNLSIGGIFDYHTATAAKRTDGRNANTMSALCISPGVTYHKELVTAGLNFDYQRNVERAKYSYLGDITGKYIYDMEGIFFVTSTGITNTTVLNRGYFTNVYGGAVQLELNNARLKFFNQFKTGYNRECDFEGNNLLKRYAFTEGLKYQYDGLFIYKSGNIDHAFSFNFLSDEQLSYSISNIYELVPDENNTWTFYEYGKTLRYMQQQQHYGVEYKMYFKRGSGLSFPWIATLGSEYIIVDKDYKIYPAKYHQDYTNTEIYARLEKNIYIQRRGVIDFNLSADYVDGNGTMLEVLNPVTTGALKLNESLLKQDFAYKTADRAKIGFGVKYTHIVNPAKGITAYFGANYTRQFLINEGNLDFILNGALPGTYRYNLLVNIGLNF